jgi:hypothetical protein
VILGGPRGAVHEPDLDLDPAGARHAERASAAAELRARGAELVLAELG